VAPDGLPFGGDNGFYCVHRLPVVW
jgi:hypothetical protein